MSKPTPDFKDAVISQLSAQVAQLNLRTIELEVQLKQAWADNAKHKDQGDENE